MGPKFEKGPPGRRGAPGGTLTAPPRRLRRSVVCACVCVPPDAYRPGRLYPRLKVRCLRRLFRRQAAGRRQRRPRRPLVARRLVPAHRKRGLHTACLPPSERGGARCVRHHLRRGGGRARRRQRRRQRRCHGERKRQRRGDGRRRWRLGRGAEAGAADRRGRVRVRLRVVPANVCPRPDDVRLAPCHEPLPLQASPP